MEEQLREALNDERLAIAGWPDPVSRISQGIRRRRRRRRLTVIAAIAAITLLGTSVALTDDPAVTVPTEPIAWLAAPVDPPQLARRSPRESRPPCPPVRANPWVEVDAAPGGRFVITILLPSGHSERCTISGSAQLIATDRRTGDRGVLPSVPGDFIDTAPKQRPATIDPGEPARLDVGIERDCVADDMTPEYTDWALQMDGRQIELPDMAFPYACVLRISDWYVQPPLLNAPLTVTMQAPGQVRRGEELEYTVTVLNAFDRPIRLDRCPTYLQQFGEQAQWLRLNCAITAFPPHVPVRFTMRLVVPADMPPGLANLAWMAVLANGEVAIAELANGGLPIEVL
jgi:hypothetical protein